MVLAGVQALRELAAAGVWQRWIKKAWELIDSVIGYGGVVGIGDVSGQTVSTVPHKRCNKQHHHSCSVIQIHNPSKLRVDEIRIKSTLAVRK